MKSCLLSALLLCAMAAASRGALLSACPPLTELQGYAPVSTYSSEVAEATLFAWTEIAAQPEATFELRDGRNLQILAAEQKVVEGVNFHLSLRGEFVGNPACLNVIVNHDPKGIYKLVSWETLPSALGGYVPANVSDPDVKSAANFGWARLALDAESGVDLTNADDLKIVSAEKQLVNGMNYKLDLEGEFNDIDFRFQVVVHRDFNGSLNLLSWERVSHKTAQTAGEPPVKVSFSSNIGGWQPANLTDADVVYAANFGWKTVGSSLYQGINVGLPEILSAEYQVTSGTNYRIIVRGVINGQTSTYTVVVFRNLAGGLSLTGYSSVRSFQPLKLRGPISFVGGYRTVDVSAPEVIQAATAGWQEVSGLNSLNFTIVSASQQVVAGTNYKLVLSTISNGNTVVVELTIWHKLDGSYQVLSVNVH